MSWAQSSLLAHDAPSVPTTRSVRSRAAFARVGVRRRAHDNVSGACRRLSRSRRGLAPDFAGQQAQHADPGELVAGNVGSPRRMESTVIGDTVRICSRHEHLNKDHGRRTLSSTTAALVADRFRVVDVAVVPIRGRAEALSIHGLVDEDAPAPVATS
jgi:hypothetical protein